MIGFSGHDGTTTSATTTTTVNAGGITTITTTVEEDDSSSKNFFKLKKLFDKWTVLFGEQRILQVAMPYVYIMILEGCVVLTFSLALVFMGDSLSNPTNGFGLF